MTEEKNCILSNYAVCPICSDSVLSVCSRTLGSGERCPRLVCHFQKRGARLQCPASQGRDAQPGLPCLTLALQAGGRAGAPLPSLSSVALHEALPSTRHVPHELDAAPWGLGPTASRGWKLSVLKEAAWGCAV